MKIAFTTSTGEIIDQHFGQCQSFHIWEVGPDEAAFLETVSVGEHGADDGALLLNMARAWVPTRRQWLLA